MSIFLATSSDGQNTEGIGALVQYQMHVYFLSRLFGLKFAFKPFHRMQHYQYFNITQEKFCEDVTNFFNFPNELDGDAEIVDVQLDKQLPSIIEKYKNYGKNVILNVKHDYIMQFADSNILKIEKLKLYESLYNRLNFDENLKYFNPNENNISIHIRKKTNTDCCNSPTREYFDENTKNRTLKIIEQSLQKLPNQKNKIVLHVYSQGSESDFYFLRENFKDIEIRFHIDEYPIVSIYHMIHSDIMIMANSSMSYISHLYGKNLSVVRNSFYHKTYSKNKYFFDNQGMIL